MQATYKLSTFEGKVVDFVANTRDSCWLIKDNAEKKLGFKIDEIIDEIPINGTITDILDDLLHMKDELEAATTPQEKWHIAARLSEAIGCARPTHETRGLSLLEGNVRAKSFRPRIRRKDIEQVLPVVAIQPEPVVEEQDSVVDEIVDILMKETKEDVYMKTMESYDKAAEIWHEGHSSDDWWKPMTDKFVSYLPVGAKILDAGCGTGVKAKYLSDKGLQVTGIDFSGQMLEIARSYAPNVCFTKCDMLDVQNISKDFDGIYCQAALLHIQKSDALFTLKGLLATLKPKGLLYLSVKENIGFDEEFKYQTINGIELFRWFSYYKMAELGQLLLDAGLTLASFERSQTENPWLITISRKS